MQEHEKARAWRLKHGFSVRQLSEITGYSRRSIVNFEAGKQSNGDPIQPMTLQRYRLMCAAIHHNHHKHFDWQ